MSFVAAKDSFPPFLLPKTDIQEFKTLTCLFSKITSKNINIFQVYFSVQNPTFQSMSFSAVSLHRNYSNQRHDLKLLMSTS